jgi:hypothetical protein
MKELIHIKSNGDPFSTFITDGEGNPIKNVVALDFHVEVDCLATVKLEMLSTGCDVSGCPDLIVMKKWFGFFLRWIHPRDFGSYYRNGWRPIQISLRRR